MKGPGASSEIAASLRRLAPVELRLLLDRLDLPRTPAAAPASSASDALQRPG